MSVIVEPPIIQTPEAIVQLAIARLQATYPNWAPTPADPEYQLFLAFAYIAAEVMLLAIDVPEEIIRFMGENVYRTPPRAATYATVTSTWEATDSLGHVVAPGTLVLLSPEGEPPVAFEVANEVSIAAESNKTATGAVTLRCKEPGTEGNMTVAATAETPELIAWVKGITLVGLPGNGVEEETLEEYVKRIIELARIVKPQPILPNDFAEFARLMVPGLREARVLAVDELQMTRAYGSANTTAVGSAVQRCVTIIPVLPSGLEPNETLQREAWETLQAHREASFKAFVGSPTYTTVNVTVSGTFVPEAEQVGTEEAVKAAVEAFLSPANWGASSGGAGRPSWKQRRTVRYQDIVTAVNNVEGFGHYTTLEVNGGTSDIALAGIAPLTKAGTISVTLTKAEE